MRVTLKELENLKLYLETLLELKLQIDKDVSGYALFVTASNNKDVAYYIKDVAYLINGRHTKNDLYNLMQAFIKGLTFVNKGAQ